MTSKRRSTASARPQSVIRRRWTVIGTPPLLTPLRQVVIRKQSNVMRGGMLRPLPRCVRVRREIVPQLLAIA